MTSFYSENLTKNQILGIPLFSKVTEEMIPILQNLLQINEYRSNEYIFKEGYEAAKVYFIIEGSIQIFKKNARGSLERLGELKAPDFFGEMALMDKGLRSASVISTSRLVTAELHYDDFFKIFSKNPELAIYTYKSLAQELSIRLRTLNSKYAGMCYEKKSSFY